MRKNTLLNLAALTCRLFYICLIVIFVIITSGLIYWHINPDFYAATPLPDVISHDNAFVKVAFVDELATAEASEQNIFALNNVNLVSIYISYLQICAILWFIFMALQEFLKILRSVNMVQTFREGNITSFRKIGKYLLLVALLYSFLFVFAEEGTYFGFYVHLSPLILALISFVMAEVFKEGNDLFEEQQYTV